MPFSPLRSSALLSADGVPLTEPSASVAALSAAATAAFGGGARRLELIAELGDPDAIDRALAAGFAFDGRRRGALGEGSRDAAAFVRLASDSGLPVQPAFPSPAGHGLSDGVIALREASPEDAEAVFEMESDPVSLAVSVTGEPDRAEIERMLARAPLERRVGPAALFAIVDVDTGRFAGTVRLRANGPPQVAMFGYAVHPAFRGRAFTTRALRLLSAWVFASTPITRLELGAKTDNVASQKAALAAGFGPDGVMLARLRNPDGSFSDEARFFLLKQ